MKKMLKYLWIIVVFVITLVGFSLRYTNDENNKAVLLISNFEEIKYLEEQLGKSKDEIVDEKKSVGISGVLIGREDVVSNKAFLKQHGLKPVLKINSDENIEQIEQVVREQGIKYIWFEYDELRENRIKEGKEKNAHLSKTIGYPDDLDRVKKMIKDNKLIVIAKERISQISIQDTKGIKDIIKDTNYSMNRMYSVLDKQLTKMNGMDMFYEVMRSIVDRGIRVVEIKEIKNPQFTVERNYRETSLGTKEIVNFISDMGYDTNKDLVSLDARELNMVYYVLVMMGLGLVAAVYFKKLFELDLKMSFIVFAVVTLAIVAVCPNYYVERNLALIASVLYSGLSSLVVMKMCEMDKKMLMIKSILAFLGINFLGGFVVVSCLSSLKYTMTLQVFRGVKIAFVLPLLMYVMSYIVINKIKFSDVWEYVKSKSKLGLGMVVIGVGFILAIYILRSGNFKIFRASALELRLREILEYKLKVRPRTKEMLIGYPMLMLLVHLRNSKNNILKFVLGFGMTIGSISVVNSFCHVFTPIEISEIRGLYGMIIGVFFGGVTILVLSNSKVKEWMCRISNVKCFLNK